MSDDDYSHELFVRLLSESSERVYSYVRTLVLNDPNDAEDVFQSSCVAAWSKFSEYEQGTNFAAWVCRIAYYEVLQDRRKRKRIRYLAEETLAALAKSAMPIADQVRERREALAECVQKLADDDLAMVRSRYFDCLKPKQIALQSKRSVDAVYRDLRRINRQLMRCVNSTLR